MLSLYLKPCQSLLWEPGHYYNVVGKLVFPLKYLAWWVLSARHVGRQTFSCSTPTNHSGSPMAIIQPSRLVPVPSQWPNILDLSPIDHSRNGSFVLLAVPLFELIWSFCIVSNQEYNLPVFCPDGATGSVLYSIWLAVELPGWYPKWKCISSLGRNKAATILPGNAIKQPSQ